MVNINNPSFKKVKIKNEEIVDLIGAKKFSFPKYTTQIINLANKNSKGTSPKVVGQMSELIQQFTGKKIIEWEHWYKKKHPYAIKNAKNKIYPMIENLKKAINQIDEKLIDEWTEDLVITKTFTGLKFQEAILKKISETIGKSYRLSNPSDEAKGIDGFIGGLPVSIKPETYKLKDNLNESIEVKIIYYEKKKDGIKVMFDL